MVVGDGGGGWAGKEGIVVLGEKGGCVDMGRGVVQVR